MAETKTKEAKKSAPKAPARKTPGKPPREPEAPRTDRDGRVLTALIVALVALGTAIGLAVAAFSSWNQLQQLQRAQERLLPRVEEKVAQGERGFGELRSEMAAVRQSLRARIDELGREQQAVAERLASLAAVVGRSEQGWALAEVEFLLRLANQRLQLAADVPTALQALNAADARLRELADPHYLPVREQIARERDALRALPPVDAEGLSARLTALIEGVGGLPVAASHYQGRDDGGRDAGTGRPEPARDWKDLPRVVWEALRRLVSIREHDRPVRPMLPPEREYFLRHNLRLQLEAARLALLRQDEPLYRDTLTTARGWLQGYFDKEAAEVRAALAQLEDMAAQTIRRSLPDISASLSLLRQQRKLALEKPARAAVPEAAPVDAAQGAEARP